ncbi:phospholipid phosphatase 6 [Scaptodrosophila lebanonensis]|uniref:Phospholipid phosphatase 6 n=1 Tax=Drosophila lebanonensis TaxID=7225 RepID=A0A6J2UBG7_DROLE|nr:phospholipid phosphatase 6 [Scaptodrosophila lebanonensis]
MSAQKRNTNGEKQCDVAAYVSSGSTTMLQYLLEIDKTATKTVVSFLLKFASIKSLRVHCKFLEYSCDGIVWLASWTAFIWLVNSKNLFQMQLNMLIGLLLDIVVVALLKAIVRRRRPAVPKDTYTIGPDKFSFPSGHASRAFYLLFFFTKLYSIPVVFWMPLTAWAVSVTLSRLILQRHYLLDVLAGTIIGILEAIFLGLIWISEESALSIIGFVSEDNVPGGPE